MGSINAMIPCRETFCPMLQMMKTTLVEEPALLRLIAAFPFCGLLADGYRRRFCIFVGCFIVLIRTTVQTAARTTGQFVSGRFVLGFGAALASAAGPAYIVELVHPAYRGTMAGMYKIFWWMGNILAGWTTYGFNKNLTSVGMASACTYSSGISAIVMVFVLFFPELPRWLIAYDRREEALAIFVRYHGDGNEHSPVVQLQYREIIEQLETSKSENSWWDYRELGNTKSA